jgi:cell division protein FtsA
MTATVLPYHAIRGRKDSVAVLDVGSSKIACFIAEANEAGELRIIGIGHHHAKGIRGGVLIDSKEAEKSVASAVELAEKMAGVTIDNVMVMLNFPDMQSHLIHVELNIAGNAVTEQDIADMLREGCRTVQRDDREIIHSFITQYQLDGAKGIRDPRTMYGMVLQADIHIITVDKGKLVNLANMISRCHLDIAEFVAAPYAVGLGCLEEDEKDLGVAVIDMGATETGLAIFHGGGLVYQTILPIGGAHITKDLAQCLPTGLHHAERIKTLHGGVLASSSDAQHMVQVPPMGEEEGEEMSVPRTHIIQIIRPRVEEIFELLNERIKASGLEALIGGHVVLTGGASQLVGVRELASSLLARQVRLGKPKPFAGLAESVSSGGFSGVVGMLCYAKQRSFEELLHHSYAKPKKMQQGAFGLGQLGEWMKKKLK